MYEYKVSIHDLMDEIWGLNKAGKKKRYAWLKNQYGWEVHFSQVKDMELLRSIFNKLWLMSFKRAAQYGRSASHVPRSRTYVWKPPPPLKKIR